MKHKTNLEATFNSHCVMGKRIIVIIWIYSATSNKVKLEVHIIKVKTTRDCSAILVDKRSSSMQEREGDENILSQS